MNELYTQIRDFYYRRDADNYKIFNREGVHLVSVFNRTLAEEWIRKQYEAFSHE